MPPRRVCVLGAGIIGISTALRIQDTISNVTVTIVTENVSPNTTSDVAGGFWQPHLLKNTPVEKIRQWGGDTFDHLCSLAHSEDAGEAGVYFISGYDIFNKPKEEPFWKDQVFGFRAMTAKELKPFIHRYGYSFTTVMAQGHKYIPWMMKRFAEKGGNLIKRKINNLCELTGYDVIVNCTGFGAKELCDDKEVTPIRGQIMRVSAPWVKQFVLADERSAFILIGSDFVVLGGANQEGRSDTTVNEKDKQRIWRECCQLIPSLQSAKHIDDVVGLRPARSEIRLKTENVIQEGRVVQIVHNYGHGGAGVTLHWGCALEAAKLVRQALDQSLTAKL